MEKLKDALSMAITLRFIHIFGPLENVIGLIIERNKILIGPGGTVGNSPAIHCWENQPQNIAPEGRLRTSPKYTILVFNIMLL